MRETVGVAPVSSESTLEPTSYFGLRKDVIEQIRPSLMSTPTIYERSRGLMFPPAQTEMQPSIEYKPVSNIKTEPTFPDPTKADYYLPEGSLSLKFHDQAPAPFILSSEEWQKYTSRREAIDNRIEEAMLGANIG